MTEKRYHIIKDYFHNHPIMMIILKFFYKTLPWVVTICYLSVIFIILCNFKQLSIEYILKTILIPAIVFSIITVFREFFNFERPYEKYNITPLVYKDKKGHSFPSRHVASSFIISMAFLYINNILGIIFLIISVVIALTRILAGVHFIRDVVAGALFSIISGLIFIFII